jgi:hypothetical protein
MNINDLIVTGKIEVGAKLTMKKHGEVITAVVTSNGFIKTSDGKIHKSPSGAARTFNGGKPIDGWLAWKLENGSKLGSLRES